MADSNPSKSYWKCCNSDIFIVEYFTINNIIMSLPYHLTVFLENLLSFSLIVKELL